LKVLSVFYIFNLEDLYEGIQLFGFCVSGSLFDIAKSDYRGDITAEELKSSEDRLVRIVGILTYKNIPTKNGTIMKFGTFWMLQAISLIPSILLLH